MAAIISDQRLDIHVAAATDDIVVLGALRDPVVLSREQFEAKLAAASEPAELVQSLVHDRLSAITFDAGSADEVIRRARDREQDREHQLGAVRPARIRQDPPGHLNLDRLEEASCLLQAQYDPDGDLADAELSFDMGGWRTDLLPPGESVNATESYDESFAWRARQWQWVEQPDHRSDAETPDEAGDWAVRAFGRVELVDVLPYLPPVVEDWALKMTERAIVGLEDIIDDVPQATADLVALRGQLAAARAARDSR
jgi:hypothetical protein